MSRVIAVEIEPLLGLDNVTGIVDKYEDAVGFDVTESDDPDVVCWGVYIRNGDDDLAEHLFDVVDQDNALRAQAYLEKLYNLK